MENRLKNHTDVGGLLCVELPDFVMGNLIGKRI